jgi:hypothetical protein
LIEWIDATIFFGFLEILQQTWNIVRWRSDVPAAVGAFPCRNTIFCATAVYRIPRKMKLKKKINHISSFLTSRLDLESHHFANPVLHCL